MYIEKKYTSVHADFLLILTHLLLIYINMYTYTQKQYYLYYFIVCILINYLKPYMEYRSIGWKTKKEIEIRW